MAVEFNLLNLQAQPEIPRKVSSEAKKSAFERSELKSREDFSRLLRELREKASAKEKSPREQEESMLAGVLMAFPSLPEEAVMSVEEGDGAGADTLTVESGQPVLAATPGAFLQLDNAANLSAEGFEETSAVFLASTGNDTLKTAPEANVVPNVNGAIQTAGFPGITAQAEDVFTTGETGTWPPEDVFTTGETGTWPPEERTASKELPEEKIGLFTAITSNSIEEFPLKELPEEKIGLFTEWTAGSAIEGEATPTGVFDLNVADEGISEQPSLMQKEMSEAIPQQETSTRPVKNSAVLEIDLAQSGLKEETAGSPPEQESVDLLMAGDTPPATVKRRANEDAFLNHVFEAAIRETGVTAETDGRLAALDEKVPSALPKEEVIGQILNGAKLMVKDQVAKIELQLHPAELGKLELSLVVERDLVTARFVAETQGVQSLIEANLFQLRSALQEAGLTVDLLQVDVQTGNEPQLQEHSFTADQHSRPRTPAQNGTDEWLAAEESYFVEDSWHGLVNLRV